MKSVVFSASNLVVLLESGRVLVFNGTTQTWGDPSGEFCLLVLVGLLRLSKEIKFVTIAVDETIDYLRD